MKNKNSLTMKKVYFLLMLVFTLIGFNQVTNAQTNLYIQGPQTWNTTNPNWGLVPGGSGNIWKNNSTANLEVVAPVLTVSGFNPFAYGINCSVTGSIANTTTERVYLAGPIAPSINVSAAQTLTVNNILAGGRGFTKSIVPALIVIPFAKFKKRLLPFPINKVPVDVFVKPRPPAWILFKVKV